MRTAGHGVVVQDECVKQTEPILSARVPLMKLTIDPRVPFFSTEGETDEQMREVLQTAIDGLDQETGYPGEDSLM